MLFINKLFNSIACLLYFINLQLVIPGRTWILLYLGRTVYKRLWACLALYGGPRWTLCQFQRDQSKNKQFDSFYFILFNYFILGYFWQKLGWDRHLQSGSRLIQMSLANTSSVVWHHRHHRRCKMWHFLNYWYEWNNQCRKTQRILRTPNMQTFLYYHHYLKSYRKNVISAITSVILNTHL